MAPSRSMQVRGRPGVPVPKPTKSWNVADVLAIVATLVMIVALFLPCLSLGGEYRAELSVRSNLDLGVGLTLGDLMDLSSFNMASLMLNASLLDIDAAIANFMLVVLALVVALPAIAPLFSLFRKSVPVIVLSVLSLAIGAVVYCALCEGVSSADMFGLGFGCWLYLAGGVAVIICAIWALVLRHKARAAQSLASCVACDWAPCACKTRGALMLEPQHLTLLCVKLLL